MIKKDHGTPFFATSSGTASSLTLTKSAIANAILYITDVSVSATTQGTWALFAGGTTTAATTTLWQGVGSSNINFQEPIAGNLGGAVYIISYTSGTNCANIGGFYISTQ